MIVKGYHLHGHLIICLKQMYNRITESDCKLNFFLIAINYLNLCIVFLFTFVYHYTNLCICYTAFSINIFSCLQILDAVKLAEINAKLSQENKVLKKEVGSLEKEKIQLQSDIETLQKKCLSLTQQLNFSEDICEIASDEVLRDTFV